MNSKSVPGWEVREKDKEVLALCLAALTYLEAQWQFLVFLSRLLLGFSRQKQTFENTPFINNPENLTPSQTPLSSEVTWTFEQISCLFGGLDPWACGAGHLYTWNMGHGSSRNMAHTPAVLALRKVSAGGGTSLVNPASSFQPYRIIGFQIS